MNTIDHELTGKVGRRSNFHLGRTKKRGQSVGGIVGKRETCIDERERNGEMGDRGESRVTNGTHKKRWERPRKVEEAVASGSKREKGQGRGG
jgi:hypothetical protein